VDANRKAYSRLDRADKLECELRRRIAKLKEAL
jgi:hypothetical protein